jgi:hypothetical protein
MTDTLIQEPPVDAEAPTDAIADEEATPKPPPLVHYAHEDDLVFGRPVEDRGFEAVETSLGMIAGAAVGAVVAGPIGAVVGGVAGAAGGFAAGEALERRVGRPAETIDASEDVEVE